MNCSRCKRPLDDGVRFCPDCGKRVESAETTKFRRLSLALGCVSAVLLVTVVVLLSGGKDDAALPSPPAADSAQAISEPEQEPPLIPNLYNFSDGAIRPANWEEKRQSFWIRYYFAYDAAFVQEYIDLLGDYGFVLRETREVPKIPEEEYWFDYAGDKTITFFDDKTQQGNHREQVALNLRIVHRDPEKAMFEVWFAESFYYTDTDERTSVALTPLDTSNVSESTWEKVLDVKPEARSSSSSDDGIFKDCLSCDGSGRCSHCGGSGNGIRVLVDFGVWDTQDCRFCDSPGNGKCSSCHGTGDG